MTNDVANLRKKTWPRPRPVATEGVVAMSTMSMPTLTELAEGIESVNTDLEEILERAQSLLHHHREWLHAQVDVTEDLFVDFCEKDGYLAFVEALGRLQHVARELDAGTFVGQNTSSCDLLGRPLLVP